MVQFSHSPTSTDQTYTTKLALHQQTYNETYAKSGLKIGPLFDLDMVIGSACLLISKLDTQVLPIKCRVVIDI